MKAVILAGGLGSRLRPITYEIPKPLIPVKKKPILSHLIDFFHRNKISEIAVLINQSHEDDFNKWLEMWRKDMPDIPISLFPEETPRGTFGGMEVLKDWLGSEPFILSNGDELKDFDIEELKKFHESHNGVASIALVEVPNPHEYGVPVLEGGRIIDFLEKPDSPPSNFINSGLYILSPEVFDHVDFSKEYIMTEKDIFPKLAAEGKLFGLHLKNSRWYDCGTIERWEKAIKEW